MQRLAIALILVVSLPAVGFAHVSVRPRESKAGAEERYVVRVPTEGTVASDFVRLEIPADVTVLEVLAAEGATFEMTKEGGWRTAITWRKAIPPKAVAEFVFRARNPDSGDIVWKAHQHFADGTTADWIGAPGERRPAAVTKLTSGDSLGGLQVAESDVAVIEAWLKQYDSAFNAKDLEKLSAFCHPDVTIYEGGGINNGWIDYRDRHLGPELRGFHNLQFAHSNTKVLVLPGGRSAYATSEYTIKAKMADREIDSGGLETLVLIKAADRAWRIRHSHTSSRPRRPVAR